MNVVILASALVVFVLFASSAQAITISGALRNDAPDAPMALITANPKRTLVIESKTSLLLLLRRLKTGDQLVVQGDVSTDQKSVSVTSIDRIGLRELLGAWRSSRWQVFEFKDFSKLDLYVPKMNEDHGSVSLSKTNSLQYVIAPDSEDRFSIFMTDNRNVRMGFLELRPNQVNLSFTDSQTGEVTENLSLSPLRLK